MTTAAEFEESEMRKDGVLSIWLGMTQPDGYAIDAFYELLGIGSDMLGDGKDENGLIPENRDIETVVRLVPFAPSVAAQVVAVARRKGMDSPRWISILYDYAYDPAIVSRHMPDDPIFIGVFECSTDDRLSR